MIRANSLLKAGIDPAKTRVVGLNHRPDVEPKKTQVPVQLPSAVREAWTMFFDDNTECTFPGCVFLRDNYHRELAALGDECSGCQKNAVKAKYREIIKNLLTTHE